MILKFLLFFCLGFLSFLFFSFLCVLVFLSLFFAVLSTSSWFLLIILASFRFFGSSQHHVWIFLLLPVLWQKFSAMFHACHWPSSVAGSWWRQWGWYDSCHTLCCWPLKVSELACDCQFCSKLLISFGFAFRVFVFRAGVTPFSYLLICCQILNPYNLVVGLPLNSIQVDLDLKCEVVRSYWRCCILGSVAHEKTWHSNCLGMTGVANFRHAIPLQPIQNVTVPWSFYVQEWDC